MSDERYWLAEPPDVLGPKIAERFKQYAMDLNKRQRFEKIREATSTYYNDGTSISFGGEQGEVVLTKVNHFRSLITSVLSMTTAQRPGFEITAADDSSESAAQVQLGQQVIEHELAKGVEKRDVECAKRMLLHGEGAMAILWDPTRGDVVGMQPSADPMAAEGTPIHAGELLVEVYSPYDVARDVGHRDYDTLPWVIIRRTLSRYDLLAQYPERYVEITGAPDVLRDPLRYGMQGAMAISTPVASDSVYVLELYAGRSPAIPEGRYARVIADTYLEGGPLPYKRMPVILRSPDQLTDMAVGSTPMWDLLAPQELLDANESSMASTADAFGRMNLLVAEGQDVDVADVGGGMQFVKYNPEQGVREPHVLETPRVTDGDISLSDHYESQMQRMSGINDVVRGDPEASVKAGVSMALLASMAVQHLSGFQSAYADVLRESAARIIETYQTFATTERVIEVTGVNEARTVQQFTAKDLSSITSVHVELGNALMRTTAGKVQLADTLADANKFPGDPPLTREQYLAFITSGRLEPLYRAERSSAIAIRAECEALQKGEMVQVLASDCHAAHIREHVALLDGRQRMQLPVQTIKLIDEHINEHVAQWTMITMTNPALLAATGQQPAPMAMQPAAPMGPDGQPMTGPPPSGPGGAPPGAPGPGAAPAPPIPGTGPSADQLPGLPDDPTTGQPPPITGVTNGGVQA
jgi:hypothetical protein